ncbi:hypothetical protein CH372_18500 [Leptospira meyeri]|nr:hypothetical protein CH372_18500 [Leptospira meyeri]
MENALDELFLKFLKFLFHILKWCIYIILGYLSFKFCEYIYKGFLRKENWELMICSESHWTGGCGEIKYKLSGYEDQKTCMEKGILFDQGNGFECGLHCNMNQGFNVCETICNEKGCN